MDPVQVSILIISVLVVVLIILIGSYFLLYYHKYPPIYVRARYFAGLYSSLGMNKKASKLYTVLHRKHPDKIKYIKQLIHLYYKLGNFEYADNYLKILFNRHIKLDSVYYYFAVKIADELMRKEEVIKSAVQYLEQPDQLNKHKREVLEIAITTAEELEKIPELISFLESLSEITDEPVPVLEKIIKYSLFIKDTIKALENLYVMNRVVKDREIKDRMLSYADTILRLEPDMEEAIRFIGIVLTEREEYSAAAVRFRTIINQATDDEELLEYCITAFMGSDLKQEALDTMKILLRILELKMEQLKLVKKMESLALELSDEDSLLNIYEHWYNLEPLPIPQLKRLSVILLRRERLRDATEILEKVLEKDNQDIDNYKLLFDVYYDTDNMTGLRNLILQLRENLPKLEDERLDLNLRIYDKFPNLPEILQDLYEIYDERNDIENKLKYYEEFLQVYSGEKIEYLKEMGEDYIRLERFADAINIYVKLNEDDPDELIYYYKLGKLYIKIDRIDIALDVYFAILDRDKDQKKAFNKILDIAFHFQKNEDFPEALEVLFRIISIFPNHPILFEKIGDVYAGMGRVEDAKKSYLKVVELDPSRIYISEKLNRLNVILEEVEIVELQEKVSKLKGLKSDILQEEKRSLELQLASKYRDVGRIKEAFELFIFIYKRTKKDLTKARALSGLLELAIKLNKFSIAKEYLKDGFEFKMLDTESQLLINYYAFIVFEHIGENKKCLKLGIEILSHDPNYKDIKNRLAIINSTDKS